MTKAKTDTNRKKQRKVRFVPSCLPPLLSHGRYDDDNVITSTFEANIKSKRSKQVVNKKIQKEKIQKKSM